MQFRLFLEQIPTFGNEMKYNMYSFPNFLDKTKDHDIIIEGYLSSSQISKILLSLKSLDGTDKVLTIHCSYKMKEMFEVLSFDRLPNVEIQEHV